MHNSKEYHNEKSADHGPSPLSEASMPKIGLAIEVDWRPTATEKSQAKDSLPSEVKNKQLSEIPLPPPVPARDEVKKITTEQTVTTVPDTKKSEAPKLELSDRGKAFIYSFFHELTGLSKYPYDWVTSAAGWAGTALLFSHIPHSPAWIIGITVVGGLYALARRAQDTEYWQEIPYDYARQTKAKPDSFRAWQNDVNKFDAIRKNRAYDLDFEKILGYKAGGNLAQLMLGLSPLGHTVLFRDLATMLVNIGGQIADKINEARHPVLHFISELPQAVRSHAKAGIDFVRNCFK